MADSIRENVLSALATLLSGITTAGGYETNMGNSVNRGLRESLEENDLPAIVIMEGTEDVVNDIIGKNSCNLNVMIHGFTAYTNDDSGNWSVIGNKMIADIVKIVGTDTTLGGVAIDIQPGVRAIGDPDPENKTQAVEVDFTIQYRTAHLDPYN